MTFFPAVAGTRKLLEDNDVTGAVNDARDIIESFWGGSCITEDQCAEYVATCGDQGEHRIDSV